MTLEGVIPKEWAEAYVSPLNASLLPPFQISRMMELLSPERLREMTFLRSKKGGLPGSEGESSSIYRHQENDT